MKVWLIDLDGKMENLALMRISSWHKAQGDEVVLKQCIKARGEIDIRQVFPPLFDVPDRVYVSSIFRWNKDQSDFLSTSWGSKVTLGGTGIDIKKRLPPEIEQMPVDYSLYGKKRVVGFISRGCNNGCPWCVVWRKEGQLKRISTARNLLGELPNAEEGIFLDNNFLALPGHKQDLAYLAEMELPIDFNQGLDAKFITTENAKLLAACKWLTEIRLALDSDDRISILEKAVEILASNGIAPRKIMVFVLIGFSGLDSDVRRLLAVRRLGCNAFPMGFRDLYTGEEPARGWNKRLYRKYRRLITRLPQANSVWDNFIAEVVEGTCPTKKGVLPLFA